MKIAEDVAARRKQFSPVKVEADLSGLTEAHASALPPLARAVGAIDGIFDRQVWEENPAFAMEVGALEGPLAGAAKDYYRIMRGPWDRLRHNEPFLGAATRPPGAGFYPPDMTKEEFERWIEAHPKEREAFTSLTTVIRREGSGLRAVPYSAAYADGLGEAASRLKEAAALCGDPALAGFLDLRAEALLSDDYRASDSAWVELSSPLEVVIGPYETYEDTLFGFKASFEAFLCVARPEESRRLDGFKAQMPWLEGNLPIPDEHKNFRRGAPPIRVVEAILTGGETRAGVQVAAFNLPNDERVRESKGFKNVLLKNVMAAKFDAVLRPISEKVLPPGDATKSSFDAFFHYVLFHELAHGLGPGRLELQGRETEVRLELREIYSPIEEAKADTLSVYNLLALGERGFVPGDVVERLPWTYVAGLFRAARFGTSEAHGLGVALQAGALLDKGAIVPTADGRFRPVPEKFPGAFRELARELLMVQAEGNYGGAKEIVERFRTLHPAMAKLLTALKDIPVDIDPIYAIEAD